MDLKKSRRKTLFGKEAQDFINAHPNKRNDLRYHPLQDIATYYELPDGQIISAVVNTVDEERVKNVIAEMGNWHTELPSVSFEFIFESAEAVINRNKKLEESLANDPLLSQGHILTKLVTNGINFPKDLPNWKNVISTCLNISIDSLDGSLDSLKLIDKQKKNLNVSVIDFNKNLLIPIFGYIGEVIKCYWSGKWQIVQLKSSPDIFEPLIELPNGELIRYYPEYLDMLVDGFKNFSSYTIADYYTEFYNKKF